MNQLLSSMLILLTSVQAYAQNQQATESSLRVTENTAIEPIGEIILPIILVLFIVFMLISLIRYFLEFRLKNKLIDRGMAEQLSTYLGSAHDKEKQTEAVKLAILFCGIGLGLLLTYFSSPIDIHSLAIMAFSIGLSYLMYFFYLRRQN